MPFQLPADANAYTNHNPDEDTDTYPDEATDLHANIDPYGGANTNAHARRRLRGRDG